MNHVPLIMLAITSAVLPVRGADTPPPSSSTAAVAARLITVADQFRREAETNPTNAFQHHATSTACRTIEELSTELWGGQSPTETWSWYFTFSLTTLARFDTRRPLTGFYHPFADVFLIAEWDLSGKTPRIVDVGIAPGITVRALAEPEPTTIAHWRVAPSNRPAALATLTAQSIAAFEKAFAEPSPWRTVLERSDPERVLNHQMAGALLCAVYEACLTFHLPDSSDTPAIRALRTRTVNVLSQAADGAIDSVLKEAAQTPSETAALLQAVTPALYGSFAVADFIPAPTGGLVLAVPLAAPGCCLALDFRAHNGAVTLARMDLFSYQAILNTLREPPDTHSAKAPQ